MLMLTSLGTMVIMGMATTIIIPIIYKTQYVPNNCPFVPYPNTSDNKWKPMPPSNDNFEANKILMEQVASHNTMIQELNKSVASISSDIKGLQL